MLLPVVYEPTIVCSRALLMPAGVVRD